MQNKTSGIERLFRSKNALALPVSAIIYDIIHPEFFRAPEAKETGSRPFFAPLASSFRSIQGRPTMTAKRLPLAESPIRGYMLYSYHLSVTLSHVDIWPWFFSNFVQLQCNAAQLALSDFLSGSRMAKGEIHFTEGTSPFNPWLADSSVLDAETMEGMGGSISEYIVDKLRQDIHVETYVDEFYIPTLFNGGTTHFGHRLLVFGYDDQRRTFNIIGFDKNSQYKELECSYAELDEAFFGRSPQIPERTRLHKPRPDARSPAVFDKKRFLAILGEYLTSTNTLLNPDLRGDLKPESELWYGLKVYDFLGEYLTRWSARRAVGGPPGIDFRGFHILWEHKKCMAQRLKWLAERGVPISPDMRDRFGQVQAMVEAARNRVVMCRRGLLAAGKGRLLEIPKQLDVARRIETEVMEELAFIIGRHDADLIGATPARV
ncbi:MAG TPA: hypothetical protein VLC92_21810 [Rhodocyclaceae bacterium]|nr:hypothetical protein [Rhodocyclaceae bacterium]